MFQTRWAYQTALLYASNALRRTTLQLHHFPRRPDAHMPNHRSKTWHIPLQKRSRNGSRLRTRRTSCTWNRSTRKKQLTGSSGFSAGHRSATGSSRWSNRSLSGSSKRFHRRYRVIQRPCLSYASASARCWYAQRCLTCAGRLLGRTWNAVSSPL